MNKELLKEAFSSFLDASKSLENYFLALQNKINLLTQELAEKNIELKRSLVEKERSNNFLNTVLNSIDEAILVLDDENKIIMLNRGAKKLLGLRKDNFSNKNFNDLGIEIKKVGENQILKRKNKKTYIIYSEYFVKNSSGNNKVVVIKDISRTKEIENHYERNKRLIAMGEMAAKIVHEIRSPLCGIELFASILKNEDNDTKRKELLDGMISGISSLNNILSNMLYFAKERKVAAESLQLDEVISEVIKLFEPIIDRKNIYLKIFKSDILIKGDRDLLKQAVFNILNNAYHAVKENGEIIIETKNEDQFAVITIADNGCGISKEHINRIFDPFFTTRESGTGLGLAITLKIIEAHKGFIKVSSKLQKGTEFKIFLPRMEG